MDLMLGPPSPDATGLLDLRGVRLSLRLERRAAHLDLIARPPTALKLLIARPHLMLARPDLIAFAVMLLMPQLCDLALSEPMGDTCLKQVLWCGVEAYPVAV
jgi:hypothetical protein